MNHLIGEHKKFIENARKNFGQQPLCNYLNFLEMYEQSTPNETQKYLLGIEIANVKLEIELNNYKSSNNLITTDVEPPHGKEYYSVKSDGQTYYVEKNMKHRLCHKAFQYCLMNRMTLKDLGADDFRRLAELIGEKEASVRGTINRVRQDGKDRLKDEEKFYYIAWLNLNVIDKEIIKQSFPFLFNLKTNNKIATA